MGSGTGKKADEKIRIRIRGPFDLGLIQRIPQEPSEAIQKAAEEAMDRAIQEAIGGYGSRSCMMLIGRALDLGYKNRWPEARDILRRAEARDILRRAMRTHCGLELEQRRLTKGD